MSASSSGRCHVHKVQFSSLIFDRILWEHILQCQGENDALSPALDKHCQESVDTNAQQSSVKRFEQEELHRIEPSAVTDASVESHFTSGSQSNVRDVTIDDVQIESMFMKTCDRL